jgi:hypothetical protein
MMNEYKCKETIKNGTKDKGETYCMFNAMKCTLRLNLSFIKLSDRVLVRVPFIFFKRL